MLRTISDDERNFYTLLRAADQGILGNAITREVTVNSRSIAGCRWHMARVKMVEPVLWALIEALARAEALQGDATGGEVYAAVESTRPRSIRTNHQPEPDKGTIMIRDLGTEWRVDFDEAEHREHVVRGYLNPNGTISGGCSAGPRAVKPLLESHMELRHQLWALDVFVHNHAPELWARFHAVRGS